ncbi:hypothetical protein N9C96_02565 [bacterium]|nr:hypothetical protein [bacterium]
MKKLLCGLTLSLGVSASAVYAEQMLSVDGVEYPLSTLMNNCQSMTDNPGAQVACFGALSQLLEQQAAGTQTDSASVTQSLDALRAVAEYQDDETGLYIEGSDCRIRIVYFDNYYHLSRRNISSLDVYSAEFDASKIDYGTIASVSGAQAPLSKGSMFVGTTAAMRGGVALESSKNNFPARSPRTSLDDYAKEVVAQLPARDDQAVEFVLVHPARNQASADIWNAFEAFVNDCSG